MSQWSDRRAAEDYDRARPPWPFAVRAFLASIGPAPGWNTALDVAAGTGRLTEHVLAVASVVIAVEPSEAQLTVLRRRLPAVHAIRGAAEAMPLASGCADLVVAGNAFHWFDPDGAAQEIARVLRPAGVAVALWHITEWPEWFADLSAQLSDYRNPTADAAGERARSGEWKRGMEVEFGALTTTRICVEEYAWSRARFTRALASTSYLAALDDERRHQAHGIISRYVLDVEEPIVVPSKTEAMWARKAAVHASAAEPSARQ